MYDQEKIKPYDGEGEKGKLIAEMFDKIAPTYDTLNHRLSWDIDKGWRRKAIRQLLPFRPEQMLDIATGTGDFAILAARELKPRQLVGADISEGMMAIGRRKVKAAGLDGVISFQREDCLSLSFPDGTFDAVTAAFGIRNFQNLDKGLSEICRVLKKGGHLSIVELTTPVSFPMKQLFHIGKRVCGRAGDSHPILQKKHRTRLRHGQVRTYWLPFGALLLDRLFQREVPQ